MGSRKYARVGIDCALSFATEEPSGRGATEEKGTTCNLSWNGCAILSGTRVEKGSYLKLKIALPGHDSELDIDLAKVRWASPHRFGVEFLVLNPQEQARLRGFVTSRHDNERVASLATATLTLSPSLDVESSVRQPDSGNKPGGSSCYSSVTNTAKDS